MVFGVTLLLQNLFANKDYFDFEKKIRNTVCSKDDQKTYLELKKKNSFAYIPLKNNIPDREIIKKNLGIYEKKLTWIQQQKHKISFIKLFKNFFKKYSFLTNYSFPIDHTSMRKEYEKKKTLIYFL